MVVVSTVVVAGAALSFSVGDGLAVGEAVVIGAGGALQGRHVTSAAATSRATTTAADARRRPRRGGREGLGPGVGVGANMVGAEAAAKARANEARQERERLNVEDAASFLVEVARLAAVDEWEQKRLAEIRAEANRCRHEHRRQAGAALSRMVDRGEAPTAIAKLAGVKVSEVRTTLKSAGALSGAASGTLGAISAALDDAARHVAVSETA